jgi:hypothetical protein
MVGVGTHRCLAILSRLFRKSREKIAEQYGHKVSKHRKCVAGQTKGDDNIIASTVSNLYGFFIRRLTTKNIVRSSRGFSWTSADFMSALKHTQIKSQCR